MKAFIDRIPAPPALFACAALAVLAGASFNMQGRTGQAALVGAAAGVVAFAAGVAHPRWRYALGALVAALALNVVTYRLNLRDSALPVTSAGLLILAAAGMIGLIAYGWVTEDLRRRAADLQGLGLRLQEQRRLFVAASGPSISLHAEGPAAAAEHTARLTESEICCFYLADPGSGRFVPQAPGYGMQGFKPDAVDRHRRGDALIEAVRSGRDFVTADHHHLAGIFDYLPPEFRLVAALAVPIPVNGEVDGFILLANRRQGYSEDDRRLAATVAAGAGAQIGVQRTLEENRREVEHFALLNRLVVDAAGMGSREVLALLLDRAAALAPHDSARIALFGPGGTYTMAGGSFVPAPISGALETVRSGQTAVRSAVTSDDGLFSGLEPAEGNAVAEALVPIRGRHSVLGAVCLGRGHANTFGERDVRALDELGTVAGVALETARALENAGGPARFDVAMSRPS